MASPAEDLPPSFAVVAGYAFHRLPQDRKEFDRDALGDTSDDRRPVQIRLFREMGLLSNFGWPSTRTTLHRRDHFPLASQDGLWFSRERLGVVLSNQKQTKNPTADNHSRKCKHPQNFVVNQVRPMKVLVIEVPGCHDRLHSNGVRCPANYRFLQSHAPNLDLLKVSQEIQQACGKFSALLRPLYRAKLLTDLTR